MELAPFTTGVDACRKIGEERGIKGPTGELTRKHTGVDACDDRSDAGVTHVTREHIRGPVPQRE